MHSLIMACDFDPPNMLERAMSYTVDISDTKCGFRPESGSIFSETSEELRIEDKYMVFKPVICSRPFMGDSILLGPDNCTDPNSFGVRAYIDYNSWMVYPDYIIEGAYPGGLVDLKINGTRYIGYYHLDTPNSRPCKPHWRLGRYHNRCAKMLYTWDMPSYVLGTVKYFYYKKPNDVVCDGLIYPPSLITDIGIEDKYKWMLSEILAGRLNQDTLTKNGHNTTTLVSGRYRISDKLLTQVLLAGEQWITVLSEVFHLDS